MEVSPDVLSLLPSTACEKNLGFIYLSAFVIIFLFSDFAFNISEVKTRPSIREKIDDRKSVALLDLQGDK